MNLPNFWHGTSLNFDSFWGTNHTVSCFVQNLAIFAQKLGFRTFSSKIAHQIFLNLGQKLGTIALNHRMAVLCLGKFLVWPFWSFLGKKYIACGDIYMVLDCFLSFFFQTVDVFGYFLLFELCL